MGWIQDHTELGALRKFFYWSGLFPIILTIGPACEDAAMSHGLCYIYVIQRNLPLAVSYGLLVKFAIGHKLLGVMDC